MAVYFPQLQMSTLRLAGELRILYGGANHTDNDISLTFGFHEFLVLCTKIQHWYHELVSI